MHDGNVRFSIKHQNAHLEYLEFKAAELRKELNRPLSISKEDIARIGACNTSLLKPLWRHVYNHPDRTIYGNRFKRITPKLLEGLGIEAIALWIGDDGSMDKRQSTLRLCCHHSLAEIRLIIDWLQSVLGPWCCASPQKRLSNKSIPGNDYSLYFPAAVTRRLAPMLKPYLPRCMQYKLDVNSPPSGRTLITRTSLKINGFQPIDAQVYLRLNDMSYLELRALARHLGLGCPRRVNGRTPNTKAAWIAHIKAHTYVLDPLEGRAA
jgi:LAGLIDADG DNA endonuclease family